jgi:hypothetical protein
MTHAGHSSEFAADIEITEPEKQGFQTTVNFSRRLQVNDLRITFKLPYVYDYIAK